jgi:hypothetical protein
MRRRISALVLGLLSVFVLAAPVLADTGPGPGSFRDSGDTVYINAGATQCGQTTCTDTFVSGQTTNTKSGDSFAVVCVDQFTYPIKGGSKFKALSGCADGGPTVASDLSSASADATILADSCNKRSCTQVTLSVSLSLTAVSTPNAYSYTQKNQYQNCTDTFRVKGQSRDAEGTLSVNGTSQDAFGSIGAESFAFSTRCR